jgi:hypothetical protein
MLSQDRFLMSKSEHWLGIPGTLIREVEQLGGCPWLFWLPRPFWTLKASRGGLLLLLRVNPLSHPMEASPPHGMPGCQAHGMWIKYINSFAARLFDSLAFCHDIAWRKLDCLDVTQSIISTHYIDDVCLIWQCEKKVATLWRESIHALEDEK